jgi:hypothetical protein
VVEDAQVGVEAQALQGEGLAALGGDGGLAGDGVEVGVAMVVELVT